MTCSSWLLLAACTVVSLAPPHRRPTQPQVARQFLLETLRADYPAAYHRLAPEVRAKLSLPAFRIAAQPLWQQGQARGTAIELYQIGAWLGEPPDGTEWFCRFAFAADSLRHPPPQLLEITFRDTTTRQVLSFRVRR